MYKVYSSSLTSLALASRPVVVIHFAVGVSAAGLANLGPGEPSAPLEGISGGPGRAAANGHVVPNFAIGSFAARCSARVHASKVLTSLITATFRVGDALSGVTFLVRISDVSGQTMANGAHSSSIGAAASRVHFVSAFGVPSAGVGHRTRVGATSGSFKCTQLCIFLVLQITAFPYPVSGFPTNPLLQRQMALSPLTVHSVLGPQGFPAQGSKLKIYYAYFNESNCKLVNLALHAAGVTGSDVTFGTRALVASSAVDIGANGVLAAGFLAARIGATDRVRITGEPARTTADSAATARFALGVDSTGALRTGFEDAALARSRVTHVSGQARTTGAVALSVAFGVGAAGVIRARIECASAVGIAFITSLTGANGLFASCLAVGVDTARVIMTGVQSATDERIAFESLSASANGLISPGLTIRVLSARAGSLVARVIIATDVRVAGEANRAATLIIVALFNALGVNTARIAVAWIGIATGVRISSVPWQTTAHGPVSSRAALGILTAGIREARVTGGFLP